MTPARLPALALLASLAACAGGATRVNRDADRRLPEVIQTSFSERGQAGLDRLQQDEAQAACSRLPSEGPLPDDLVARLTAGERETIRYPADGVLMGDWKRGEAIAQSGVGKQYSDDPAKPSGGNCYACHQLGKEELAFGTLGPSLLRYGKIRGQAEAMQRFTFAKIYNAQAYSACSIMPRFGHRQILTEAQIKDLVALLLDPASPVNQ